MMRSFIFATGSPDFTESESLESLASALRLRSTETDVVVASPAEQHGYAVTPWEVVHIWIPWHDLSLIVATWLVEEVLDWVKGRLKKARIEDESFKKENPNRWHIVRPTIVIIYNDDGDALTVVEQKGSDAEPRVARDERSRKRRPPDIE
jgi:hypothetical protein